MDERREEIKREREVRRVRIPTEESLCAARERRESGSVETQRAAGKTFERLTHFSIVSAEPMARAPHRPGTAKPSILRDRIESCIESGDEERRACTHVFEIREDLLRCRVPARARRINSERRGEPLVYHCE